MRNKVFTLRNTKQQTAFKDFLKLLNHNEKNQHLVQRTNSTQNKDKQKQANKCLYWFKKNQNASSFVVGLITNSLSVSCGFQGLKMFSYSYDRKNAELFWSSCGIVVSHKSFTFRPPQDGTLPAQDQLQWWPACDWPEWKDEKLSLKINV